MQERPDFFKHPELGDIHIEYSPRRTRAAIGLKIVDDECRIILKLPCRGYINIADFIPFIDKNARWIIRKRSEISSQITVHTFKPGDKFYYLGRECTLIQDSSTFFDGENFHVSTHSPLLTKRELKKLYMRLAEDFIIPLCRQYASEFGLATGKIRINNARSRWGSCNSRGDINFAMHLIMCPENFIRHTICHELAHRIHMNHSKAFYAALHRLCPNPEPLIDKWKYRPF